MFSKYKYKLIHAGVFFLLSCQLLTSCSISSTVNNQTVPEGQELPSVSSTATVDAENQPRDTGNEKVDASAGMDYDTEVFKRCLIAQIPDRGIYLYGEENGVTLRAGDNEHYYEWPYMTPMGIKPGMHLADYDDDGKEELSTILHIGSGTGVAVYELHIVEIYDEQENFKDHVFDHNSYMEQVNKAIGFKIFTRDGELMADVSTPTETHNVSLEEFNNGDFGKIDEDLRYGSIVSFNEENGRLSADFGVGVSSEFVPYACYFGNVSADVEYKDGAFELKNFKFTKIDN